MITPASDCALLVSFGETIAVEFHSRVRLLVRGLQERDDLFLREIKPAYSSVLVTFDPLKTDLDQVTRALRPMLRKIEKETSLGNEGQARHVEIPVCYEGPLAPDLEAAAKHVGLSAGEVVELHAAAEYLVCFFGFMPGFSYWSGLPEKLAVPRLATPRVKVPAGSVGIGGSQTGIYPLETPGGWRIIGRTPIKLFDRARNPLCLLQVGDRVRLKPVCLDEYRKLGGTWEP